MSRAKVLGKKIMAYAQENQDASGIAIAKELNCSYSYVLKVLNRKTYPRQPQANATVENKTLPSVDSFIEESNHIKRLVKEVTDLKAVVRYLESKLSGDVRGTAI